MMRDRQRDARAMSSAATPLPNIVVTGGAGFIGSNFIQTWLEES